MDLRTKTQIIFFQPKVTDRLTGHLKYLYLSLLKVPDLKEKLLIVTANIHEYSLLNRHHHSVAFWTTEDGHQHTWNAIAKSRIVFIDDMEKQCPPEFLSLVNPNTLINLWHGKDGKETGFLYLESLPQFTPYMSILNSIRSETPVLSPGLGEHDTSLKKALPGARLFHAPDIRTWGIFEREFENSFNVDVEALEMLKKTSATKSVLWCPTFRDSQIIDAYEEVDFSEINSACKQSGTMFYIKPHRHDWRLQNQNKGYSNVIFIDSFSDVYPLIKYVDLVITDYSSIQIDLFENGIPLVRFLLDHTKYTGFRRVKDISSLPLAETFFDSSALIKYLSDGVFPNAKLIHRDTVQEEELWHSLIHRILDSGTIIQ